MNKTILLTGGLGYIGSVTAHVLHTLGYDVVIIDRCIYQQKVLLPWAHIVIDDIGNLEALNMIFSRYHIDAVMHFAGLIEVGQSVKSPDSFYHTNVIKTIQLLDAMRQHNVDSFIFSSSCAVYGNPVYVPMDEKHSFGPINPYGKTKLAVEYVLNDYAQAYGLRSVALRYFNAAGALSEYGLGENHNPETHVIPLLLRAALQRKPFMIFGTDYDTADGSCVRDYVHVYDIARAHVLALEYLWNGGRSDAFNLGTGVGYTVQQLIASAQNICKIPITIKAMPRRAGDAAVLVANAHKAKTVLGWQPVRSDLQMILRDAWEWEQRRFYEGRPALHPVVDKTIF
jgi:UDP-glucose 4-epimerase